jgi:hypothetical protein
MRAEARLTLGDAKNALTVPIQAVFQDGPVQYVNKVVGAGKVERVPIKLGKRSDTRAEILAGVSLGDSVLLRDPQAAELAFKGWNADQLKSVGYVLDEKGQPMPSRGQSGMPGPGGGPPKGERPTGAAQPGGGAGASPGGGAPRGERRAREGSGGQDAGGGGGAPQQPGTAGAPTAAPKVPAGTK